MKPTNEVAICRKVSARASYRGANRSIEAIWKDCATAFPSTSAFPSADPPGMPLRSSSPTTDSATPTHNAAATGVRNSASAIRGVKTTYSPVMNPVLVTVVSSSPAVCRPYGEREQHTDAHSRDEAGTRQLSQGPPRERREHDRRDREANGEEREQRVQRERVLHLHERDAPDRGHADQREQRRG